MSDAARSIGAACCLLLFALVGTAEASEPEKAAPARWQNPPTEQWLTVHDPARASAGFTLDLYERRVPILMNMSGETVHSWPGIQSVERLRLLEDCNLLTRNLVAGVSEYDWEGKLLWEYVPDDGLVHHDVIRLRNGNTAFPIRRAGSVADDVIEVARSGETVWEWRSEDHLDLARAIRRGREDITHINSVHELPDNPWFDAGDERFRPGNLLISARHLNRVFLVDKASKAVVWSFDRGLKQQHEALMIGPGMPGHGNVLVFNNKTRRRRQSEILEIDPIRERVIWRYREPGFFSGAGGVEQPLPNGNVLITSSRGGRVFEVARNRDTVWELVPPYQPMRARRYASDHCPKLEALGPPVQDPARKLVGPGHVDRTTYSWAAGLARDVGSAGEERLALMRNDVCEALVLPADATGEFGFGLISKNVRAYGVAPYAVRFRARLEGADGAKQVLVDEPLDDTSPGPVRRSVSLKEHGRKRVRICVEVDEIDPPRMRPTERYAFWDVPAIRSQDQDRPRFATPFRPPPPTEQERRAERDLLEALGYVE